MSTTPSDVISNPVAVDATPLPDAPYRGIAPFRFIDQQIFAARDDEIWALVSNVTLYRAVLLYGESGTGKSSLINAGLLPQALAENYVPDRLRVQPLPGREIKVERIRTSDSQGQPACLPSNFATSEGHVSGESIELSLAAFRERIEQFRAVSNAEPADAPFGETNSAPLPLLIFDQFEEFVTLFEEAQRSDTRKAATSAGTPVGDIQQQLLKMFVELIRDQNLPVKIVFSFREDYLAKLSLLFDFCPELQDQAQRLLPPHVKTLPQIIRAPFKDAALIENFRQHSGGRSEITKELAQKISDQLSRRSENDRANLTELQIVCQRLWEAPDPEALFAKNIEGILDSYGDDVIDDFTPTQRDAAVCLLSHLITSSDTRNIISEEDLLTEAQRTRGDGEASAETLRAALKSLTDSQIVRRERRRDIYFYEISSEYLVPWIKKRVAARQAEVERDRALKTQKELEAQRLETEAKFRKEKTRLQVVGCTTLVLIALLVATAVLGVFAYRSYRSSEEAKVKAESQKQTTDRIVRAVAAILSKDNQKALAGVTEIDNLIKERGIDPEQRRILLTAMLTNPDLDVRRAALKVALYTIDKDDDRDLRAAVVSITESDPALRNNLSKDVETNFKNLSQSLPPRLYLHIAHESQREKALKLEAKLEELNYITPGIENAENRSPLTNELRYFRKGDSRHTEVVKILETVTGEKWNIKLVTGYKDPDHLEIWFGAESVTENGQLSAYPADEQGNFIRNLRMRFTITDPAGKVITRRTGHVPQLAPGNYSMEVVIDGYETVNETFSIARGKETKLPFKVVKKST